MDSSNGAKSAQEEDRKNASEADEKLKEAVSLHNRTFLNISYHKLSP